MSDVLDLHGHNWAEALAAFIEFHNRAIHLSAGATISRLESVHGYGSTGEDGVILKRLRAYLERHREQVRVEYDGNPGHTYVTPVSGLPKIGDMLQEEIVDYCDEPRTLTKITGRFRWHGDPAVLTAIRLLEREGRLKKEDQGKHTLYRSL